MEKTRQLYFNISDEEWDLQEEDIAILLAMHANKRAMHGGSSMQKLQNQKLGTRGFTFF
jgi:hypothetical protein